MIDCLSYVACSGLYGLIQRAVLLWCVLVILNGSVAAQIPTDTRLVDAIEQQDWDKARQLLAETALLGARQVDLMTALHWAVWHDRTHVAQLLIERGANVGAANRYGIQPLMAAAGIGVLAPGEEAGTEEEALACVEYLLRLGADVNSVDANGETAMHGAAYKSLPRLVSLLAERGADRKLWTQANKYGWTPMDIAAGHRPGNFKPSEATQAALQHVLANP